MRTLRLALLGVVLVAVGCAGAAGPTTAPTSATAPPTQPSATPRADHTDLGTRSPSPAPSVEFIPPTVASFAPAAGTPTATWDLVALGDSNVSGWGVRAGEPFSPDAAFPGVYADLLADQQGVGVVLHSYYPDQLGNEVRTVAEWADVVRADPAMRADLREAEIVVVLVGFHDLLGPLVFGGCPGGSSALIACLDEATAPMAAAFAELYAEVAVLVPDGATVLVSDYFGLGPLAERWSPDPAWPEIRRAAFDGWRGALEAAAIAAGFNVVHTSTAMSHPDGRPRWDTADLTSDGLHFNAEGHRLIAEAFVAEDGFAD